MCRREAGLPTRCYISPTRPCAERQTHISRIDRWPRASGYTRQKDAQLTEQNDYNPQDPQEIGDQTVRQPPPPESMKADRRSVAQHVHLKLRVAADGIG